MVKKKTIPISDEEAKKIIEAEVKENVKTTFSLGSGESEDDESSIDYSSVETQKIILMETLDAKNIMSMTNLSDDEIEDIENARMLNGIFNNPLIENMCNDHMHLKKSLTTDSRNLLTHLFDWSTRGFAENNSFNPITKVLGKKGAR